MHLFTSTSRGSGPPVVLLHGVANSSERYAIDVVTHLREQGRSVLTMDLRGHGHSDRASSYRLAEYAADVAETLKSAGVGPVVLVGHSMGGAVAAEVARTQPDTVIALFLEDPALFRPGPGDPAEVHDAAARLVADLRSAVETELTAIDIQTLIAEGPSSYPGQNLGDVLTAAYLAAMGRAVHAVDPSALEQFFAWPEFSDPSRWRGVLCPTTVLRADPQLDAHFLPEDEAALGASIADLTVEEVRGAGHSILLHPDGPQRYLDALNRFLATVSLAT